MSAFAVVCVCLGEDQTSSIWDGLAHSSWLTLIGFIATAVSLILAVVFYFKGKRDKDPRYWTHGANLIRDLTPLVSGLQIKFRGHAEPITQLTVTKLLFWNTGQEPIRKGDY